MDKYIHITTHEGKMEGIPSISTSVLLNKNCEKNSKIIGSICSHCYAHSLCEMRKGLAEALKSNTELLTNSILPEELLPDTTGMEIFRFEAFGDLNNEVQLQNYINIVKKNPSTRFSLYTKGYDIVYKYFSKNKPPKNFTLVISSLMTNKELKVKALLDLGVFAPGQLKTFTVYSKEYLLAHPDTKINCGSRECNHCRLCYNENKIQAIHEILKTDQNAIARKENWENPEYRKSLASAIEDIDLNNLF